MPIGLEIPQGQRQGREGSQPGPQGREHERENERKALKARWMCGANNRSLHTSIGPSDLMLLTCRGYPARWAGLGSAAPLALVLNSSVCGQGQQNWKGKRDPVKLQYFGAG